VRDAGGTHLLDPITKQPTMSRDYLALGPEARSQLVLLTQTGSKRVAARAQIVLLSERGLTVEQIASELSLVPPTVYKWRRRYAERGIEGLHDLPRPGQPLKLTEQRKQAIVRLVTEAVPDDALEWSIRRLAKVAGVTEHQARSVLKSRRLSPLDAAPSTEATSERPLPELGGVYLGSPIVGAVLLVDVQHPTFGAQLAPGRAFDPARLARCRHDPSSLYRAFFTSESGSGSQELRLTRLARVVTELSHAAPPSRTLELIVAPGGAFSTWPGELIPNLRVVPIPTVSAWLRNLEGYLLSLEAAAGTAETLVSELKALRTCLAQHNTEATPSGAEFFWKSPRLAARSSA